MSTITIPAREILAGDVLDLGGQPVEVTTSEPHPNPDVPVHYLHLQVDGRDGYGYAAMHGFNPDTVLVVTRPEPPDPDAAVIEAIAEYLCAREDSCGLSELLPAYADELRTDARALLAVAREAGAL